ncbi:MAG: hypothetical protein J5602_11780, partial [Clostridia bacterium]|nr:hypothetical protein [Clostridia bacterium]
HSFRNLTSSFLALALLLYIVFKDRAAVISGRQCAFPRDNGNIISSGSPNVKDFFKTGICFLFPIYAA